MAEKRLRYLTELRFKIMIWRYVGRSINIWCMQTKLMLD